MKRFFSISLLVMVCFGCVQEPEITEDMLDGNILFDPSLYEPERYLISHAIPSPTAEQAETPVIIVCHGYTATTFEWSEFRHWIGDRDDILVSQELQKLITLVRKELQQGIALPAGSSLKVYKSKKDPSADPVSAALIYQGVKTAEGQPVEIEMIDSELHVYTNLALRDHYSAQDIQNQQETFNDIINRILR